MTVICKHRQAYSRLRINKDGQSNELFWGTMIVMMMIVMIIAIMMMMMMMMMMILIKGTTGIIKHFDPQLE